MTYTPSSLTCPGSLVWAADIERGPMGTLLPFAECPFCQARLALDPNDRAGNLPAHDADDDKLPIPAADLEDFIAEVQADCETRTDAFERDVTNHILARLVGMWRARKPCVDPDHGVGDHPCDETLGAERAALLREDAFEAARDFDRTHPGYWEYTDAD